MSAPPRYASMQDSSSTRHQSSSGIGVGGEYELLSLREEVERLRRDNNRYKEEMFDLRAVELVQREEAKTEASQKLRSLESEMTFKEKNLQDVNRKYIAIKRDLALQKQEIKQLKALNEAASKVAASGSSSSSQAAAPKAAGRESSSQAATSEKADIVAEMQQTIERLQRQLVERSAVVQQPSQPSSSAARSNRSRLLDDQTISQLVTMCYEVLVALLLRSQGQPQVEAGPQFGDTRTAYSAAPATGGTLPPGSAMEAVAEIEQAFVALQISLSSSQCDEVSLLNLLSLAASGVYVAYSCLYSPSMSGQTHSADGSAANASPDNASSQQRAPAPPRSSQESSYTALNSTRTPSLLSMAADRHRSSGSLPRARERRGRDWAVAEPLPLLLRFLSRLLGTITAAAPRVVRQAREGGNDLATRFDAASHEGLVVKRLRTQCDGALLASLSMPGAPTGALREAHTACGLGLGLDLSFNSECAGHLLDAYLDLLSLVASLVKQLLGHMSPYHSEPQLPPPLQLEVDQAAVELLLLLQPSSEGLIPNDFLSSKLLRRGAEQQDPFLLSLFSDVDVLAERTAGQCAGAAVLTSLHVQTQLLQYLEQLLSDPEVFQYFSICQVRDVSGGLRVRSKKRPASDTDDAAKQSSTQHTTHSSFCSLLANLVESYSAAAHLPSASSCEVDGDAGSRAVAAAKVSFSLRALRLLRLLVRRHWAAGVLALFGVSSGSGSGATVDLSLHPTRDPSAINAIVGVASRCARQLDGDWGAGDGCTAELMACAVHLLAGVCEAVSLQGFNNITTSESSQLVNGLLYRWCYGFCHERLAPLAEPLTVFYAEGAAGEEPSP